MFSLIFERLHEYGTFLIDYRPLGVVFQEDGVISRQPQNYGEIIVTTEEVSGCKIKLAQFYPNEHLLFEFVRSNGFRICDISILDGTKYVRKAITLEKERAT